VIQKMPGVPRVLARDQIDLAQHPYGTVCDVLEIPYRCRDDV
jgi:hypothetical protein